MKTNRISTKTMETNDCQQNQWRTNDVQSKSMNHHILRYKIYPSQSNLLKTHYFQTEFMNMNRISTQIHEQLMISNQ